MASNKNLNNTLPLSIELLYKQSAKKLTLPLIERFFVQVKLRDIFTNPTETSQLSSLSQEEQYQERLARDILRLQKLENFGHQNVFRTDDFNTTFLSIMFSTVSIMKRRYGEGLLQKVNRAITQALEVEVQKLLEKGFKLGV